MAAAEGRKKLADVTPASYEGWARFAERHRTNATALAEVFGLYFADLPDELEALPPALRRCVIAAVELHLQRKRRPQV